MKVDNSIGPNIANVDKAKNAKSEKGIGDSTLKSKNEGVGNSAQVNLSNKAQQMKRAMDIAKATPDVDEAKVSQLQKLIDEGKYEVNASSIADKLVDEHLLIPSD